MAVDIRGLGPWEGGLSFNCRYQKQLKCFLNYMRLETQRCVRIVIASLTREKCQ